MRSGPEPDPHRIIFALEYTSHVARQQRDLLTATLANLAERGTRRSHTAFHHLSQQWFPARRRIVCRQGQDILDGDAIPNHAPRLFASRIGLLAGALLEHGHEAAVPLDFRKLVDTRQRWSIARRADRGADAEAVDRCA